MSGPEARGNMADEMTDYDDDAVPDPFEAELVAYLDGELDPASARKVEARLENDPEARARADALKKSFDLLDYLPKPEPSPNFTTRTLDLLPAIKDTTAPSGAAPRTPAAARPTGATSGPSPAVSTSMPVAILEDEPHPQRRGARSALRVAGLFVAVAVFAGLGYFATVAARPALFPARDREPDEARNEPKVEPDARVIECLPLYAVADDIAFVQELTKPELFGDEPAVAYDAGLKVPHGDPGDRPTGKQFEALAKSFRAMSPARQAEIVKLDQELQAKEPRERDRLFRALEVYAVWLERLPDPERRAAVLGAATPALRQRAILEVREQQWIDALPPPRRKLLDSLVIATERAAMKQQWKDEEAIHRERWAFVRQHVDGFAANKSPWPFDTETGRKDVIEFARNVFRPDDPRRCRLTPDELTEYRRTLALAERDGAWAWYGLTVYELSKAHPYLPEPAEPKQLITDPSDLPEFYARATMKKGSPGSRLKTSTFGKWPEFPLEVLKEVPMGKFFLPGVPQLGPAWTRDFKEPVRTFAEKELFPKMTGEERAALQRLGGRWPEYPREFVRYAVKYDLTVPGVTLPGAPKKWDATYGAHIGVRPK